MDRYKITKLVQKKLANKNTEVKMSAGKEDFVTEVSLENFKDYLLPKIKPELEKKWGQKINIHDIEVNINEKAHIKWNIEFEMRDWGIKYIYFDCPNQKINIYGEIEDTETEKKYSIDEDVEIKDVEITKPDKFSGQITPNELMYYNGKLFLEF